MKALLTSLCAYNVWANQRLLELLNLQPSDLIDRETISSYPTIRKTIYHMWDAQLIWLNRLQGISLSTWPSAEYDEHFTGYNIYFLQQCEDFVRFVETRTDSYFEGTCFYKALNGTSYQTMNWQIILHCMNHSTYHRGQLVTMLRNLGVEDLPATDYIQFVREQQKSIL